MRNSTPFLISITLLCSIFLPSQQHQRKDCIHQCGETQIPYPFGIGPSHCYINNSYLEVICKVSSSSTQVPYLKKLNLEILNILPFSRIMTVKIPSVKSCNGTQIKWNSPNLNGTPFSFRFSFGDNINIIASFGCGGFALVYNDDGNIGGCTSTCNDVHNSKLGSSIMCSELNNNCCLINTLVTKSYSIIVSSNNGTKGCRLASLVSRDYLASAPILSIEQAMRSAVPVVLVLDSTLYSLKTAIYEIRNFVIYGVPSVISFLLACCCVLLCWCCKTRKRRKEIKLKKKYFKGRLNELRFNQEDLQKTKLFTENEIKKATENFNEDRIIGAGGQGTVYKGILPNGELIAVKKSISLDEKQWREFINEVIVLSHINHRNVVKLLGCCLETKAVLLVYEFIPTGTLSELIHSPSEEFLLTWDIRVRIASEVAGAIAYLHSSCSTPIYHRDIKSSNILLDQKYRAKLCDFGISRSTNLDQTHVTTLVRGTFGYLDPEYFRSRQYSEKSDVYSFGVVLVEIITGKKPISVILDYAISLVDQFMSLEDDSALYQMLDPIILANCVIEDVIAVANLAKRCLNAQGTGRPTMMQVAMELACLYQNLLAAK